MLLYPSLAITALGSVPTATEYFRTFTTGAEYGRTLEAGDQHEMWQRNYQCLKDTPPTTVKNSFNVEISSLVCPSGDILLSGLRPDEAIPHFKWVSLEYVVSDLAIEQEGMYMYAAQPAYTILCQRWIGKGLLLMRVHTYQGCFDRVVDTFNNVLVSNRPAPCNPQC